MAVAMAVAVSAAVAVAMAVAVAAAVAAAVAVAVTCCATPCRAVFGSAVLHYVLTLTRHKGRRCHRRRGMEPLPSGA